MTEQVITRDEVVALLFNVSDIALMATKITPISARGW
jgi:hypothetical protein